MGVITQGITTILIADFVTGFVHWAEDAYARRDTPIIGKLVAEANIEHHQRPRAFLARSWWSSSWDLLLLAMALVTVAWWCDRLTWHIWLFALLVANANQMHKWTHQNPTENGRFITWLQEWKFLQTRRHHAQHHHGEKNTHYCVITNFLNPVLEEMELWRKAERFMERWFGLKRRPDPTVKSAQSQTSPAEPAV
jgi:hypothetical protein